MIGKRASKEPELFWWRVIKTRDHGGTIQGQRRKIGDTFQATESAMTFDLLEELVEKTTAPAPVPAPAAAPAAEPVEE